MLVVRSALIASLSVQYVATLHETIKPTKKAVQLLSDAGQDGADPVDTPAGPDQKLSKDRVNRAIAAARSKTRSSFAEWCVDNAGSSFDSLMRTFADLEFQLLHFLKQLLDGHQSQQALKQFVQDWKVERLLQGLDMHCLHAVLGHRYAIRRKEVIDAIHVDTRNKQLDYDNPLFADDEPAMRSSQESVSTLSLPDLHKFGGQKVVDNWTAPRHELRSSGHRALCVLYVSTINALCASKSRKGQLLRANYQHLLKLPRYTNFEGAATNRDLIGLDNTHMHKSPQQILAFVGSVESARVVGSELTLTTEFFPIPAVFESSIAASAAWKTELVYTMDSDVLEDRLRNLVVKMEELTYYVLHREKSKMAVQRFLGSTFGWLLNQERCVCCVLLSGCFDLPLPWY
eukprot:SAG11_NODE_479_length_9108_cov_3.699856_6_plen_401_part_00